MPPRFFIWIILFGFALLQGCGVKLPPVAPDHLSTPAAPLKLDCSPTQEDCDREDPNYRPKGR